MSAGLSELSRRDALRLFALTGGTLLIGGGALSACAPAQGGSSQNGFKGEIAVAHLQGIMGGAPFIVADELGYFEEEGLSPELVSFPGGTDTVRGIASGIQFGMPATLPALIAFQKGQKNLRLISGAVNAATVVFLVPQDSEIQGIEDLRGKKIAVSEPGSITTYFATRIVQEQGLTPGQDVEILHVGGPPDAWTAAQQGIADVAWSSAPLSSSLTVGEEARLLFATSDYVTNWVDNSYWTTQDVIDETPEVIEQILRALKKAVGTIKNDLDTAAPVYAQRVELSEEVARDALEQVSPFLSFDIDMAGIEENVKAGSDLGQLDAATVNLDEIVVPDFVRNL